MTQKIKIKTKGGELIYYPTKAIKEILDHAGFAGKHLAQAGKNAATQAKQVAKQGIISATDFEKVIINAIKKTQDDILTRAKKVSKKVVEKHTKPTKKKTAKKKTVKKKTTKKK